MVAVRNMQHNLNYHQPVLLREAINGLNIQPEGTYVDATFGRGGHSTAILERLGRDGRLFAIDRDLEAVSAGKDLIKDPRFKIWHGAFADLNQMLDAELGSTLVNGILFDLGVSSPQLDNSLRGFSFKCSGPLDMRMDSSSGIDAAAWIKDVAEEDLAKVIWQYGDERYARRIASSIVSTRKTTPFTTTKQLAECISAAIPKWPKKRHPATRSFQAIRIAVNDELGQLKLGLSSALEKLAQHGRMAVISFHSLEDRMVKRTMRWFEHGDELPRGLPIKEVDKPKQFSCLGRAIKPSITEIKLNPRSRSAVLRVGEKLL